MSIITCSQCSRQWDFETWHSEDSPGNRWKADYEDITTPCEHHELIKNLDTEHTGYLLTEIVPETKDCPSCKNPGVLKLTSEPRFYQGPGMEKPFRLDDRRIYKCVHCEHIERSIADDYHRA